MREHDGLREMGVDPPDRVFCPGRWEVYGDKVFRLDMVSDETSALAREQIPVGDEGDVDSFLGQIVGLKIIYPHLSVAEVEHLYAAERHDVAKVLDPSVVLARVA